MNNKSFDIQNEIRQNAMKAHDSIKGLKQWESEMKENELKVMKKLEQNNIEQQQVNISIIYSALLVPCAKTIKFL